MRGVKLGGSLEPTIKITAKSIYCMRFIPRPMWPEGEAATPGHLEYMEKVVKKLWALENPQFRFS